MAGRPVRQSRAQRERGRLTCVLLTLVRALDFAGRARRSLFVAQELLVSVDKLGLDRFPVLVEVNVLDGLPIEARAVSGVGSRARADMRDELERVLRAGPVTARVRAEELAILIARDLKDCARSEWEGSYPMVKVSRGEGRRDRPRGRPVLELSGPPLTRTRLQWTQRSCCFNALLSSRIRG